MKNGQEVIKCPNCSNNGVRKGGNVILIGGVAAMLAGLFIPIIGWFVMIPVGLIFVLVGWFKERKSETVNIQCTNCKHIFKVGKPTYEEYKNVLNQS